MESASTHPVHVLVAEDDPAASRFYERLLKLNGYHVTVAADGRQARSVLDAGNIDVVLSDIGMPHLNGIQLLQSVGDSDQNPPVILVTGNPHLDTAMQAVEARAVDYLVKPVDADKLLAAVKKSTRVAELARARRNVMKLVEHKEQEQAAHLNLSGNLDRALQSVWMAFQPIVSVTGRCIYSYEALVRNDDETLRNPMNLLGAAEKLNRLPDLGRTIRDRVAARMPDIAQGIVVFVNLHPLDLLDDHLYQKSSPLTHHASRVVLEITERASLADIDRVEHRLHDLRALGYRFALDDLGAGYAGLNAFVDLNPDVVKLDMALIRDIHANPTKKQLVASISEACRGLKKLVVAEGVETAQERAVLEAMHIDLLQGYLLGRPARDPQPVDPALLAGAGS